MITAESSRIPGRSTRLLAFAIASIAAFLLFAAFGVAGARAEDTFSFDGRPGPHFTATSGELPECWSDASGVFQPSNKASENGQIHADLDIFDACEESWAAEISYGQRLQEPPEDPWDNNGYEWKEGYGGFWFGAEDPTLEPATLSCWANGAEWVESLGMLPIEKLMSAEVDGTTCKVEWLPGVGPGSAAASSVADTSAKYSHFVDSLASVAAGKAWVAVQTYGRRHLGVEDEITLRTKGGHLIGQATTHLEVGDKRTHVAVPIDRATRRALAAHGFLVVRAAIRHIDGSAGAGDTTTQLVLRRATASHR
jgi:hypothetical protein